MTAVPSPTFGPQGFEAQPELAILAGVQEDLQAAFGGNLNPSPATPQGQLATSMAATLGAVQDLFVLFSNLVDPALTSGRMQDAIARIYFITRIPSAPTVFEGVCIGVQGVTIPAGATCQDQAGNNYICTSAGTFDASGTMTLPFSCIVNGPTPVPVSIDGFQLIPGWDAINVGGGSVGSVVETPQQFEARRSASVAWQSLGPIPAIRGAVLQVPGVLDCFVIDNSTGSPETIGTVTLSSPSLYVSVLGGDSAAVAQAIWSRKIPGCPYYAGANTSVTVFDTSVGYSPPFPSYVIKFDEQVALPFVVNVDLVNSASIPANALTLIQQAVIAAFSGMDGGQRIVAGSKALASRLYAGIAALGSWAQIIEITMGSTVTPGATFTGAISAMTLTASTVSGTIAPGQTVFDATGDVVAGTTIVTQLTGPTGGAGTYTLSTSQTVSSEAMSSAAPTLFEIQVGINQAPSIAAANISVTLT